MKKLFAFLFAFVALQAGYAANARAQTIDFRKLGLMLPDHERNARLYWGDTKDRALTVLGSPTRTWIHYSEIDEKTIEEWYYGTSVLYFKDGVLDDYELKDRSLLVGESFYKSYGVGTLMGTKVPGQPGQMRKSGKKIPFPEDGEEPSLPPSLPAVDWFYDYNITKRPGTSRNIPFHIVSINHISDNGTNLDSSFQVLFDSDKIITNISLGD